MRLQLTMKMLLSAMVSMALVSGPQAKANGPESLISLNIVQLAQDNTVASKPGQAHCIGTLLRAERLITAAHCIQKNTQTLSIRCASSRSNLKSVNRQVQKISIHTKHDVAVVQLDQPVSCRPATESARSQSIPLSNESATTLFTIASTDYSRNSLEILEASAQTYVADDNQCMTQGDSGTPAFTVNRLGTLELAAILISGTSDCPALQILANVSDFADWVKRKLD